VSQEIRKVADRITVWLREYLASSGADGYVLGLSGGVDSATAAGLAVRAVGSERVLGALLPCHSQPKDARLGQLVADTFGIPTVTVDLSGTFDTLAEALPPVEHLLAGANIKPRLRMTALYFLAQSHNYLVLGGANKTELEVGYFTKHGDSGVDLMPLADVYKTDVWKLARELGVPQEVIERPPTAGLWPDQTDEIEMGITYDALDRTLKAIAAGETDDVESDTLEKVREMMRCSAHKRAMPPICLIEG
jgi:NAD+ synthase